MTDSLYLCPICQSPLFKDGNSLKCENNHCFDFAKEGYVNLLPVQHKKSLNPGDDQNMVVARREFLQQGHYQFLQRHLIEMVRECHPNTIIDLGCGEGYYTSAIQQSLPEEANVFGLDISKSAVKYSAKRNKNVHYSVSTNAHLPFADNTVDVIVNVFAPFTDAECRRVLQANGKIISVNPGPKHLFELKQHIYDNVELHQTPNTPEGFELIGSHTLEQQVELTTIKDLENLLTMTPFGWKITEEKKQILLDRHRFQVTLCFNISEFSPC